MSLLDFSSFIVEKSQAYSQVLNFCHELLFNSECAKNTREYLFSRYQSLSPFEITFGYFPNNQELNILIKKFGIDNLVNLKLIYNIYSTNLYQGILSNHNLIFPYLDEFGNIISLIGRYPSIQLFSDISKYKTLSFNKSLSVFGLFQAKEFIWKNNKVIIVEGQFDCLSLWKSGIKNVVALGGANITPFQLFSLLKYTNNFYLLLDQDAAGKSGINKIIHDYKHLANWYQILLPSGYKDVDIYLEKHSFNQLENWNKENNERFYS